MICLFICDTEFQLLNALNIKYHLLKGDIADIIVHNRHPEDDGLLDRVKDTKLFRNVYSYIDELKGVHQYIRDMQYNQREMSIFKAMQNSSKMFYNDIRQKIFGADEILRNRFIGYNEISKSKYDEIFAYTNGKVYKTLINQLKNISLECKLNYLDEGIGSYYMADIDGIEADNAYLYNPDISVCHHKLEKYVKIPKINRDEKDFIDIINFVFDASELPHLEIRDAIIFCDQGFQQMPPYLSEAGTFKKIIFSNAYKKHMWHSVQYNEEIRLFKKIIKTLDNKKAYIKFHPRYATTMLNEYDDVNVKILAEKNLPFELICANYQIENSVFITPISSSTILHHAVLGNYEDGNRYILLYNLMDHNYMDDSLKVFCQKLVEQYGDKFLVPRTEKELDDLLTMLSK